MLKGAALLASNDTTAATSAFIQACETEGHNIRTLIAPNALHYVKVKGLRDKNFFEALIKMWKLEARYSVVYILFNNDHM